MEHINCSLEKLFLGSEMESSLLNSVRVLVEAGVGNGNHTQDNLSGFAGTMVRGPTLIQ